MNAQDLKLYIYENDMITQILEELGMHHIKWHDNKKYITCGMPDGDNKQSTVIYNNEFLNVTAYTRDIVDENDISDIISLVSFIKKYSFRETIFWLSNKLGLGEEYVKNKQDYSKNIIKKIKILYKEYGENEEELKPLEPLDERVLKQYQRSSFQQFVDDNISDQTQYDFELGLDLSTSTYNNACNGFPQHRITIPIRDENGTLVGVKGRILKNVEWNGKIVDEEREKTEPKYIYLYPCAKSQILYGVYKTYPYIKERKEVIICESEKGVMQLWTYGFKNAVAIGGHELSITQVKKILGLNTNIIIAYDKDVAENHIIKECEKLSKTKNNIFYILDNNELLKEKESPMDNPENWKQLYEDKICYSRR